MGLVLRLALVSAAFYVAFALLTEGLLFGLAIAKGGANLFMSRSGWFVFYGIFWLAAFSLTWKWFSPFPR